MLAFDSLPKRTRNLMNDAPSKTKVFWNEHEKRVLCAEAARLLHGLHATRKLDALMKAQAVLPANRRRKLLALTGMAWYEQGLSREIEILKLQTSQAEVAPTPPEPPRLDELTVAQLYPLLRARLVTELASFVTDVLHEVRWPETDRESVGANSLGSTLLKRLVADRSPSPDSSVRKRTSVLVVGLKGGQMEEVRRDFGKELDLRFFGADENKEKLRAMCEQVDFAIAMTGFISHAHEEIMTRRTRQYVRCSGGITRLKDTLQTLVHEGTVATSPV